MVCKFCGQHMADPELKVIVQEKIVVDYREESVYIAKWLAFVLMFIALVTGLYHGHANYVLQKISQEQSIKIKITDYDANGRPIKELIR